MIAKAKDFLDFGFRRNHDWGPAIIARPWSAGEGCLTLRVGLSILAGANSGASSRGCALTDA